MQKIYETRKKNYTEFEKYFLGTCISKYRDIIENKKSDGTTIKQKSDAWEKVMLEFNNCAKINEKATAKQLHRLWNNIKQRQRAELARDKLHRTGGSNKAEPVHIDPILTLLGPNHLKSPSVTTSGGQESVEEDSVEVPTEQVAASAKRISRYSSCSSLSSSESLKRSLMETEANDKRERLLKLMEFDNELHQERLLVESTKREEANTREKIALLELKKLESQMEAEANDRREKLLKLMQFENELHHEQLLIERAKREEAESKAKIALLELKKLQRELEINS